MSFDDFFNKKNENKPDYKRLMSGVIKCASKAKSQGDISIGAMLYWQDSHLTEHSTVVSDGNPLCTATLNVLNKGFDLLPYKVSSATLYCTVEPDVLSVLAAYESGIREIVFGAYDSKNGFISSGSFDIEGYDIKYKGGVLAQECLDLLPEDMKSYCSIDR